MILTDTHTHLYTKDFKEQIETLLLKAKESNVERFFLPNIDATTIHDVFHLSTLYPKNCFPMMGLHPSSVKEDYLEQLSLIKNSLSKHKVVAIGEIGIDLYWDKTYLKEQEAAFTQQIRWAKAMDLPIVIHAREAYNEIFKILEKEQDEKLRGVFHCYTAGKEEAAVINQLGNFYFGIGGVITYKNANELREVLATDIPLEKLLLETDAPYLAPHPFRGKTNLPEYLLLIAEKVASVKNMSLHALAEITTQNSKNLFGV